MLRWIASFDIGKKNFAFCIEEVNISDIPYNVCTKKYNEDGTCTESYKQHVIDPVCRNGRCILFVHRDITDRCEKGSYLDPETFHNMTDMLDEYITYFDKCSAFIIEKQMSFGKVHNTMALKLGQHCYSYFVVRYGRFKDIIEYPAYYKTQVLGAKKLRIESAKTGKTRYRAIDKPTRKKWTVTEARRILTMRGDTKTLSILNSTKKKDDLADVLCQLQAFKVMSMIKEE